MSKRTNNRIYLTPVEVAEMLMVSTASVRLWASKGVLPAQTTAGGHRRFLLCDIEAFAKERGISLEPAQNGSLRVLIVDDDEQLRSYLCELLVDTPEIEALEVAGDGFDAGLKVKSFKPDVLLLDLMMPGMNGFDVCSRLKTTEGTRDIRVIAMSGCASQDTVTRILSLGAELCLSKPIDTAALFSGLGITA